MQGSARASALILLAARANAFGPIGAGGRPAVRACLFDFDNTLVQSEELHRQCFGLVLGEEIDEQTWVNECVGTSPRLLIERRLRAGRLAPGETVDDLLDQRSLLFEQKVEMGLLQETKGATRLLDELADAPVTCAIVSSGAKRFIDKGLRALGLDHHFETIVAGDDDEVCLIDENDDEVCSHKPQPLPYTLAAQRLGVRPEECVAFEDTISGVRSAQAAGMRVVVMRSPATATLQTADDAPPAPVNGAVQPVLALVRDFDDLPRELLDL